MKRRFFSRMVYLTLTLAVTSIGVTGCALLGGGEDDASSKNFQIKFAPPQNPYQQISGSTADVVWQSNKTGNTIAVNSLCRKYQDVSLDKLKSNILSAIENLKIEKSEIIKFDGREAEKTIAHGQTDGIPISVNLVIFKKNNCTYDLAYISRATLYEKELSLFESFLEGFHVP